MALSLSFCTIQFLSVKEDIETTPWSLRWGNGLISYVTYLSKMVWPVNLAAYYPLNRPWPLWHVVFAAILVLAISVLAFALRGKRSCILIGWLWFLGLLVPVIGLVPIGGIAMADRFSYLPSIGILIALVWALEPSVRTWRFGTGNLVAFSIAIILAVNIMLTRRQAGYWANTETLFRHALTVTKDNWYAHTVLAADCLSKTGREAEAEAHCRLSLKVNPHEANTYNYLGMSLANIPGRLNEALAAYKMALRLKPTHSQAHNNLGGALSRIPGRTQEAIVHYETALQLQPRLAEAHNNLGVALMDTSRQPEAIAHFQTALRNKSHFAEAHFNLASALMSQPGHEQEAIAHFRTALRINPSYYRADNNLGLMLLKENRSPEAIACFESALRTKPDYYGAHYNLGLALLKLPGRTPDAMRHFQIASTINPEFSPAKQMLQKLQATQN